MFVKIAGVRGSGKTTVTAEMHSLFTSQGIRSQTIKGSELMARYLGIDPNELPQVPERDIILARNAVYRGLYANDLVDPKRTVRFRDGHCAIVMRGAYGDISVREVPLVDGDTQQLRAICLLDPDVRTILTRRQGDIYRRPERNITDVGYLFAELEYERDAALRQADTLGIPLYVHGNDGTIQETAGKLSQWLHTDLGKELDECRLDIQKEGRVRREFA